jgi:hypothetical protein
METPKSMQSPEVKGTAVAAVAGSELKLELNARGTPHQLACILENAAKAIRSDEQRHPLPWFDVCCGSVTYDWKVTDPTSQNTKSSRPDAADNT